MDSSPSPISLRSDVVPTTSNSISSNVWNDRQAREWEEVADDAEEDPDSGRYDIQRYVNQRMLASQYPASPSLVSSAPPSPLPPPPPLVRSPMRPWPHGAKDGLGTGKVVPQTISDDRSVQHKVEESNFHALKDSTDESTVKTQENVVYDYQTPSYGQVLGMTEGRPTASVISQYAGTPTSAMAMAYPGGQIPNERVNSNMIARKRALDMMQAQNGGQMQNMGHTNAAQLQQMNAMNMPAQQMQHMTPQQQQMIHQQQQYQNQQRMMAQHAAAQQQIAVQQRQQAQLQDYQQQMAQNTEAKSNSPAYLPHSTSIPDNESSSRSLGKFRAALENSAHKSSRFTGRKRDLDCFIADLDIEELQSYAERLQRRIQDLGGKVATTVPYRYQILYRIRRADDIANRPLGPYFDMPEENGGQAGPGRFQCRSPVTNLDLYLERNKDISFLILRTYIEPSVEDPPMGGKHLRGKKSRRPAIDESIRPVRGELTNALRTMLMARPEYIHIVQDLRLKHELPAPYIFCYHHRADFARITASANNVTKEQLDLFLDYVKESQHVNYELADELLSQGRINHQTVEYLFKAGDTVVFREDDNHLTGWVAETWPRRMWTKVMPRSEANKLTKGGRPDSESSMLGGLLKPLRRLRQSVENQHDQVRVHRWDIEAWRWKYDGFFSRHYQSLPLYIQEELDVDVRKEHESATCDDMARSSLITDLLVYPLHFCPPELVEKLRHRGHTLWGCRERQCVSYEEDKSEALSSDERYMIDYMTYRSLHKSSHSSEPINELGDDAMSDDQCPQDPFPFLMPLKVKGFNLRRKKWYDLWIDRISKVEWKTDTFLKVVMDPKAKEIVRALISKQIVAERSTDLIAGKGNGLILLLHGGPGTGKTLTAESVAEIAQKPLYRVTCGDVGTKAEAVEKYLESVFHLGKLWGCVVLLDEADVFLEQRDLKDLERNALVSVFLRVLEYYEGILILTSNRVGTFDDAFRSRIQLALHYPTLNHFQRFRIWENFIDRLEGFNDGSVNIPELKAHLEDLSQIEMNGREIRNTITTARQYADHMKSAMCYSHLKDVIEISGRFGKYLNELHGLTAEEIAKDGGLR